MSESVDGTVHSWTTLGLIFVLTLLGWFWIGVIWVLVGEGIHLRSSVGVIVMVLLTAGCSIGLRKSIRKDRKKANL